MSEFYVDRIYPRVFTYKDAVATGECIASGFVHDPMFKTILGDRYTLTLDDLQAKTGKYHSVVHAWARIVYDFVLTSSTDLYLLKEKHSDKVVGEALWKYPQYMVPALSEDRQRFGYWWQLTAWLRRKWISVQNFARILLGRSPLINRTMLKFLRGHQTEFHSSLTAEQAKGMSYDQLKDTLDYPHDMMVFCVLFSIRHDYQGKGLGKLLMNASLDTIPRTSPPAPFAGPQKVFLEATRSGKFLYERTGFVDSGKSWSAPFADPKLEHISTYMVLTRDN